MNFFDNLYSGRHRDGFTLVELTTGLAIIGLLLAAVLQLAGGISGATRDTKLKSHVGQLNRAIKVYRASGGNFEGGETAEKVLEKLKTYRNSVEASGYAGLGGSMIDGRLSVVRQTQRQAYSGETRVYWNATETRFELKSGGVKPGIREFALDESLAGVDFGIEERDKGHYQYDTSESSWVWAHSEHERKPRLEPTKVTRKWFDPNLASVAPGGNGGENTGNDDDDGGIALAVLTGDAESGAGGIAVATGGAESSTENGVAVGAGELAVIVDEGIVVGSSEGGVSLLSDDGHLDVNDGGTSTESGSSQVTGGSEAGVEGASADGAVAVAVAVTEDAEAHGANIAAAISGTGNSNAESENFALAFSLPEAIAPSQEKETQAGDSDATGQAAGE